MKALSNFGVIMDLLQIKASDIDSLGFDRTLVSRWRSGKRRIMPGRRFLQGLAALIWEFDGKLGEQSRLPAFLRLCFPAEPCETHEEQNALLFRLLTDVHQMEPESLERRKEKLARLFDREKPEYDDPTDAGNKAYGQRRLLAFMDKALEQAEPEEIYIAHFGRLAMFDDEEFSRKLEMKFRELSDAGHVITQLVANGKASSYQKRYFTKLLPYYISGHCRRFYGKADGMTGENRLIGVIRGKCAVELYAESAAGGHTTRSELFYDEAEISRRYEQLQELLSTAEPMLHMDIARNPASFLGDAELRLDKPCYLFVRMPFWRIRSLERFAEVFMLKPEEIELLRSRFGVLVQNTAIVNATYPVRLIFCEDDIEDALLKRRTLMRELSDVVGRRVWTTGAYLLDQLTAMYDALKNQRMYEVCILPAAYFETLRTRMIVFGDETAFFWTDDGSSAACKVREDVAVISAYCEEIWNAIPEYMRDRQSVRSKLERWLIRGWDFTGSAREQ
ncbi:MAG: hypothetical protein LBQ91_05695 [Oscillospiraceae bacterium]|jgi:hypothetical protein|nr:hypothetical protein [Oscillospiraceae bacterium]